MSTLSIINRARTEASKEILDIILDIYEEWLYENIEEYIIKIQNIIEREFLFRQHCPVNKNKIQRQRLSHLYFKHYNATEEEIEHERQKRVEQFILKHSY